MHIEPPYPGLWKELKQGNIVAFLGAGASLSSRPPNVVWNEQSDFLPKGSELSQWLADEVCFPSADANERRDLAKVASYFVSQNDRDLLRQRLRQVFARTYQPGSIHQFLAEVDVPLLIVTTNYDNLIELCFQRAGKPYHLVVHPTDQKEYAASVLWWRPGASEPEPKPPTTLPLSLTDTTIIYKMHGSAGTTSDKWDNFVVTEEDYMDFLSRMSSQAAIPKRFMLEFRTRRFLFLGYSLADWNLRVILRSLRTSNAGVPADPSLTPIVQAEPSSGEGRRSWAIQVQPSDLEKWLWDKRQVNIYDMKIEDFVERLRRARNPVAAPPANG